MKVNVPGFRTRTTWKMVLAAIAYSLWFLVLASFISSIIQDGGPVGGLVWFIGISGAAYVLIGNPNGLCDRLPIKPNWLKLLTWGFVSLVAVTAVALTIPESPEYEAYSAQQSAIRKEQLRVAALKQDEEKRIAAERKAEEKRTAAERKAEAERVSAEKKAEEQSRAAEKAEAERVAAEKKAQEQQAAVQRQEAARQTTAAVTTTVSSEPPPPPSSTDRVRATVVRVLGQNTNMKTPRIRDVKTSPWVEAPGVIAGYVAAVTLNGDENLTTSMTRSGLLYDTKDLLQAVYEDPQLKNVAIEWQLPLVDVYGKEADERVILLHLDAATAAKIEWSRFLAENLNVVAQSYWEHPALTKK